MDKFQRVPKDKDATKELVADDEIRITLKGKVRNYITYALALFQEKELRSVQLKAMGNAISKQVTVAEILKRRVAGLHQLNVITSTEVLDEYEPLEEGLDKVSIKRLLTTMEISLSLDALDSNQCGYQAPLPEGSVLSPEDAKTLMDNQKRRRNPRNNTNRRRGDSAQKDEEEVASSDNAPVEEQLAGLSVNEEGGETTSEAPVRSNNRRRARGPRRGGRGGRSNRRRSDDGEDGEAEAQVEE